MIRVAVAGAAGRMGATTCAAVDGADDMDLVGRADPSLGTTVADVLGDADVLVDFTRPDQAVANARQATQAGVHVVIGTTGFAVEDLRAAVDRLRRGGARVLGDGEPKIGAHGKPVIFLHPKDFAGTLIELEEVRA